MPSDMHGCFPQFHLSSILSKLQCADGLWDISSGKEHGERQCEVKQRPVWQKG